MKPLLSCLALPCLLAVLSAQEVGMESAAPARFGAKFSTQAGKRVAEFNGDHGVFAFHEFDRAGDWNVEAEVTVSTGGKASLVTKVGNRSLKDEAKAEGDGQPHWVALGSFRAEAGQPVFFQVEARDRKGTVKLSRLRFAHATDKQAQAKPAPLIHLRTAYAESEDIRLDRAGAGAATWTKAGGRLLIPVSVEQPGRRKLSLAFTRSQGGADLRLQVIGDLTRASLFKTVITPVRIPDGGAGKGAADCELTFPSAGTHLIAIEVARLSGGAVTLGPLRLRDATNEAAWALPNGNAQSVHFNYPIPKGETAQWVYAEAKARPGPPATYHCVLGFGQGYFGYQRKAPGPEAKDRCFIFSVWDNGYVRNQDKAKEGGDLRDVVMRLVGKGEGVNASAFDHEGSGGHSDLPYAWKDEVPYAFLLGVKPDGDGAVFSAWIRPAAERDWKFLASFRRPKTVAKLDGLYSFTEDWAGSAGQMRRSCEYSNLWARTADGRWLALRDAGTSATAELGRADFSHTVSGNAFVLSTGGYGPPEGERGKKLQVPAGGKEPSVDFEKLPN